MRKQVIILENFSVGEQEFSRGEVYWLHSSEVPLSIKITNLAQEFITRVPMIDRNGNLMVEVVSQKMVETIQKIQNREFPRLSKLD